MKKKLVIAVDFDGTLCYTKITADKRIMFGNPNTKLIERLIEARKIGHEVILWTCRQGDRLKRALEWCKNQGLEFDKVNEDVDSMPWEASRKILADIYIDDKAMAADNFIALTDIFTDTFRLEK